MNTQEIVKFSTSDRINLAGIYIPGKEKKGIILLHQFTNSKESWKLLLDNLSQTHHVLALDLRGHGQSELNWEDFHEKEFSEMIHDSKAAYNYLKQRGINEITIIGASIGANLALKLSLEEELKSTILLSPGIKYRGLPIDKDLEHVKTPTLIITGSQDAYSHETTELMKPQLGTKATILTYDTKYHGTMLLKDKNVIKEILAWLKKH